MGYYIKKAGFSFAYLFFMAITAVGIMCIGENLLWLKILLSILNFGLYCFIVGTVFYKDGQEAVKVRHANDLERREMIRTGSVRSLKLKEEYKPWKGYFIGFITCIPLLLLLLIHTVILVCGGTLSTFGGIADFIYLVFYVFFCLDGRTFSMTDCYFTLIALPVMVLLSGFCYNLGAKKVIMQQNRIKEQQRQIYGE